MKITDGITIIKNSKFYNFTRIDQTVIQCTCVTSGLSSVKSVWVVSVRFGVCLAGMKKTSVGSSDGLSCAECQQQVLYTCSDSTVLETKQWSFMYQPGDQVLHDVLVCT